MRRLDLTSEVGPWKPRLERLSGKRGLDEFEKNIVLALVSVHIALEIREMLSQGRYRFGSSGAIFQGVCVCCVGES